MGLVRIGMRLGTVALCCDLLFGGLARLVGLRGAAGAFGFLLRRVALSISLVLLSLTLPMEISATGPLPGDLLGFALHAFNGAFNSLFDFVALSRAASPILGRRRRIQRRIRGGDCVIGRSPGSGPR